MIEKLTVIYWDSTALLSYLFKDMNTEQVVKKARQKGYHLLTTLTLAEVYTVVNRIRRERLITEELVDSLLEIIESGPWSRLNIVPNAVTMKELACKWPLHGSRLWHLAAAKTLQLEFPELVMITFDRELARASRGENLKLGISPKTREPGKEKESGAGNQNTNN